MSLRNLRKCQSSQAPVSPTRSPSPASHFLVKKNKFSFQLDEDIDSDSGEDPLPPLQIPDLRPKEEEKKTKSDDFAAILEEFKQETTVETVVSSRDRGPLLRKEAKHFNSEWEIAKKFRTATVQSRTHATRTMKRTLLTPNASNWPVSVEYVLDMEVVQGG